MLASHEPVSSLIAQINMSNQEHSSRSYKSRHKDKKRSRSRDKDEKKRKHRRKRSHSDHSGSRKSAKHKSIGASVQHEDEWSLHQIDKEKLLEIAQSNLSRMLTTSLQQQQQQPNREEPNLKIDHAKSNSVSDFIKLCQNLSHKHATGRETDEDAAAEMEAKRAKVKRVFEQLKEHGANEAPSSSPAASSKITDTCKVFPVSSGEKHRKIAQQTGDQNLVHAEESNISESSTLGDVSFGSQEIPGEFKRESGVKLLTPEQLEGNYKAWVRKDYLINAEPIKSAIGMKLMEKMGWRSGQGLGKNKEGPLEPIKIVVKVDRKGLVGPKTTTFSNKAAASVRPQGKNLQL